jgi:DHA2 family multidrug resistance protein
MAASVTAASEAGPGPAKPAPLDRRRMFAFVCMVFGMFMAILDIQIVSASLADIQAGLSASSDEISWVQTSYLIAEVIMIPLSGTLSRVLSTRWMFVISSAGFTLMSFMCAMSSSIEEMIVWRALQGFIGGGMIPTVFASAFTVFPPEKRPIVSPMIGLVATLAPTVGPTVGGYLTDLFSWHWLFLVNIVPGIFVTVSTYLLVDFDEPQFDLFKSFDWLGLAFMGLFLGSLEYVLEEGPVNDWFQDDLVLIFTGVCALAGVSFFYRAFTARHPIVDLRAFADRNFAAGCAFSFVVGIGLYGLT